jgi:hypothetical protein
MITRRMWVYALLAFSACSGVILAQTAPPQVTGQPAAPQNSAAQNQADPTQPTLTPIEERDRQIREFDPLDREEEDKDKIKAQRELEKRRTQDQTPTPGSIAASDLKNSAQQPGPQVVEDDDAATPVQEYSGPAVLSRSYSVNRPLIPEQVKWQESAGISSVYDTGVTRPVNADGSSGKSSALIGTSLTWSFSGRRYFRRDQVSINYQGNMSQYSGSGAFNGTNQQISVEYSHVLSRRLTLTLSGAGSILSQNYVLQNQTPGPDTIANVSLASSPNIQIYDTGTKQFSSQADLVWQKSSRLSFSFGTSFFGIARDSTALLGVTGQQVRSDVNYRLSRKTTVGAYYAYSHYLYPHGFGNSDTNSIGLIYSYAFNRTLQIRFRGGVSSVESLGLQTVPISPVIAVLLGEATGIIDAYHTSGTSDISAQVVKDFRGGSTASIAYARGVSPGNGVFQTSQQESISLNLSIKVRRSYLLAVGGGRDTLSAVAQALGKYESENARISLSRPFRRGIGLNFALDYRHFDVVNFGSLRNQLRVTSGITWSSGTGRLWPF